MKKHFVSLVTILSLIGIAILFNYIGNFVHSYIYDQSENETRFTLLLYLRHFVYGLIFLTGFSFIGYHLMKISRKEKTKKTKVYRNFLKGEKLCFGFFISSFIYSLLLVLFYIIGTDPEVLLSFVNTLMFVYPISIIAILIIYGRDSTYVMDGDRS